MENHAITGLSVEEKRLLLAKLMRQNKPQPQLSVTQERMWQLHYLQPDTGVYNFQSAIALDGPLRRDVLEAAVKRIPVRHEVLRTRYGVEKGQPRISIASEIPVPIGFHDLSALSPEEQERDIQRFARADAQGSFNLSEPPLFRVTLAALAPDRHVLILTMHHIVSDLLSLEIFLRELGELYSAAVEAREPELPQLAAGYQDFARLQRSLEERGAQQSDIAYWRETLSAPAPLEWFSDYPRPARATMSAATEFFSVPPEVMESVEAFSRAERVTPFMVLLAGFNVLLHACSGQNDMIVGSPTAGRIRSEYEALIGMFSYPLVMRTDLAGNPSFGDLVQRVRKAVLGAAEHADLPFAKVVDAVHQATPLRAPLVRAMFSYVSRLQDIRFSGMTCRRYPTDRGISDFDMFLTVYREEAQWHGVFEYNTDLFTAGTIRKLIAAYSEVLRAGTADRSESLVKLAARVPAPRPLQVTIAATFTADPLQEIFDFWSEELRVPMQAKFAPYNQVFQQLLDPQSQLYNTGSLLNVLLVRPEDWARYAQDATRDVAEKAVQEFIGTVRDAAPRMHTRCCIYICPASSENAASLAAAEASICDQLAGIPGVEVVASHDCAKQYPVVEVHSPETDRIGHVPYTQDFFAALGTALVRKASSLARKPYKVVVLDCDNTLWRGVCAEDGVTGVRIDEPFRALQTFLRQQVDAGILLCLCSKNSEADVLAVFREHPAMVLKEEHVVAHRINWEPKWANLRALASELQLGLDTFIFMDDNPVECAEVSSRCPEVLTLRLPENPDTVPHFLEHVWAFDRQTVSEEDRKRAQSYRDNTLREKLRSQSASFADFIRSLNLEVSFAIAESHQVSRIAQLSQRTTQFNSSGIRYGEAELQQALAGGLNAAAVKVRDRFGDYGLVGAVLYRTAGEHLRVESFLLSCRVLGRGVEYRIAAELGRIAESLGLESVLLDYRESPRNLPFRRFLDRLPGQLHGARYIVSTNDALRVSFTPEEEPRPSVPDGAPQDISLNSTPSLLARVAEELTSVEQIRARLARVRSNPRETGYVSPQNDLEKTVAAVWSSVLHVDQIGRDDNFFEVGGNSLLLVQVNSGLIEKLGIDVAITELFQYPTVSSFANHVANRVSPAQSLRETQDRSTKARERMQQRKRQLAAVKQQEQQ
jgi:FkbH-like protein